MEIVKFSRLSAYLFILHIWVRDPLETEIFFDHGRSPTAYSLSVWSRPLIFLIRLNHCYKWREIAIHSSIQLLSGGLVRPNHSDRSVSSFSGFWWMFLLSCVLPRNLCKQTALKPLGRYRCWWRDNPRGYHQPSNTCFSIDSGFLALVSVSVKFLVHCSLSHNYEVVRAP